MKLFLLFALIACAGAQKAENEGDPVSLYGVHMADDNTAYAVGNLGAVVKTTDGGRSWQRLAVPVNAVFRRCFFISREEGWVVGGTTRLLSAGSAGVVLHTSDGGKSWDVSYPGTSGSLFDVRFLDAKRGWVCGASNDQMDNSLYATTDGGKSWKWVKSGRKGWLYALAVLDDRGALVAGTENGAVARLVAGEPPETLQAYRPMRELSRIPTLRAVRSFDGKTICAAGDNCAIAASSDGGKSWSAGETDLDKRQLYDMDIRDLCFTEQNIAYAVGGMGGVVLVTVTGGKKWRALPSPRRSGLWGVSFSDLTHGIAVGDLGSVITTSDGGKTWTDRSLSPEKIDVLFILGRQGDEARVAALAACLALDEGYRTGFCFVTRDDRRGRSYCGEPGVLESREAVNRLGGLPARTYDEFEPFAGEMDEAENRWAEEHGTDGQEMMNRMMTAAIRACRPEVVVAQEPVSGNGNDPCAKMAGRAAAAAFQRAGQEDQYPDLSDRGLRPWSAKRLYYTTSAGFSARPSSGEHPATLGFEAGLYSPALKTTYAVVEARNRLHYLSGRPAPAALPVAEYLHLKYSLDEEFRSRVMPERWPISLSEKDLAYRKILNKPADQRDALLRRYPADNRSDPYLEDNLYRLIWNRTGEPDAEDDMKRFMRVQTDSCAAVMLLGEHVEGLIRARKFDAARRWIDTLAAVGRGRGEMTRAPLVRSLLLHRCQLYSEAGKGLADWFKPEGMPAGVISLVDLHLGIAARLSGDSRRAAEFFRAGAAADDDNAWRKTASSELFLLNGEGELAKKKARAVRRQRRVLVDGDDDDADWNNAPSYDIDLPAGPGASEPPFQKSDVRFLYDDENLYVFGRFSEERMAECIRNPQACFGRDTAAFYFDPGRTLSDDYIVSFTPVSKAPELSVAFPKRDKPVVDMKIKLEKEAWCAELRVSRNAFGRFEDSPVFSFNMSRIRHSSSVQYLYWEMAEPNPDLKNPVLNGYLALE